ncbi:unnamed protein product [Oikopleura dioica]|uniref:Uncharacterized protein n=1 Tax=Oikopleura dioica TaxID=34765 RepID=E4YJS2_OIKDI|nr:unnamed protein product [Oikopleura dioica]
MAERSEVLNCVEPLIEFQTCPLEETIKNHNWNSWSECNDGQRIRSRRVSSKCGSLFLKKHPNYHIREQSSETGECTACTPPEWSDWERDDSGCLLVRKCVVLDDQDDSCNKECIGKSKKEVPCITATICNKVVQLTNHRDKALTLRRSNYESKLTYRYSSETPSLDSLWTICCSPEDGQNVAVLYNEPNNLKLIKATIV